MSIIAILIGNLSTAHAVPIKLTQQGRLLDSSGVAVEGIHAVAFRFFDSQLGGSVAWEEALQLTFVNGYYSAILGGDSSNPLDDSVLSEPPLYLEVEVDGGGPIGIRQEIVAAPYSRLSGTATNLSGGSVDASEIRVSGSLIIDLLQRKLGGTNCCDDVGRHPKYSHRYSRWR